MSPRSDVSEEPPRKIQKLTGFSNFKRSNPKSDRFEVKGFHHVEFWTTDATNTARRFSMSFGMQMMGFSDVMTGNQDYASYALRSRNITFVFTAPYFTDAPAPPTAKPRTWADFDKDYAYDQIKQHGFFGHAIAIEVADAQAAYEISVKNGARSVKAPFTVTDEKGGSATISEVSLYADTVLRYVSLSNYTGPFLPGYEHADDRTQFDYGLERIDHIVGNVPELLPVLNYVSAFTGFHEFAEFVADDIGATDSGYVPDSGLNAMVLASNNEMVLLPINEPTFGTKRKSQIQTFLEHHRGGGLQHIALLTRDIFKTLKAMRQAGGVDFMPPPPSTYYTRMKERIGDDITPEQHALAKEYGVLVDKDDQGILLQIFTRPLQDRPTVFVEIIQRVGCEGESGVLKGGCGGFGKGNFSELFKSIEDFERLMDGEKLPQSQVGSAA